MKDESEVLSKIVGSLQKTMPPQGQAILFGSRARGDNREDSDWDILVILDKDKLQPSDYDVITYPLTQLGWEVDELINPIMYSQKEWDTYNYTPFYKNVMREGKKII